MIRQNALTLGASSGLLIVAGALGMWAAGDAAPSMQAQPSIFQLQDLSLPHPAELATYATTLARPLFSPDRRPFPMPQTANDQAEAGANQTQLPVTRLVAVAIGPDRRAAIVQLSAGGTQVLMLGEHIDDWVLAQIAPDHVVLRQGAQEASVSLPVFPGAAHPPVQK